MSEETAPFRSMVEAKKQLVSLVLEPTLDVDAIVRLHAVYYENKAICDANAAHNAEVYRQRESAHCAKVQARLKAAQGMSKAELLSAMGYDAPELAKDRERAMRSTHTELVYRYSTMIPYER